MTLELASVSSQVQRMVRSLKAREGDYWRRLEEARGLLHGLHESYPDLRRKIERSNAAWAVALPEEPPDAVHPLPPSLGRYCALAVDGSQIDVDRHGFVPCYLINLGSALLHYGPDSRAHLRSEPSLFFEEEDLYVSDSTGARQVAIQGNRLASKRSVLEVSRIAEIGATLPRDKPCLALIDGTLLLWSFESGDDFIREAFQREYHEKLARIKAQGLPIAGYISRPRAAEVVNMLRIAICPDDPARCGSCSSREQSGKPRCAVLAQVADRALFDSLAPGERSALFQSRSLAQQRQETQPVYFFYLGVGNEVARLEVPDWVAREPSSLALVHALAFDQARRGNGYPTCLQEAHQQAVVTGADRQCFNTLVEQALVRGGVVFGTSQKSRSKSLRPV